MTLHEQVNGRKIACKEVSWVNPETKRVEGYRVLMAAWETAALLHLCTSTHFPQLLDAWEDARCFQSYVSMDYVDGMTLFELNRRCGIWSSRILAALAYQVLYFYCGVRSQLTLCPLACRRAS